MGHQADHLNRNAPLEWMRLWFLLGTTLLLVLIVYGFLRIPAALSGGLLSLSGAVAVVLVFGLFAWLGLPAMARSSGEQALRLGGLCGLLAGLVYLATFLIEYSTAITGEQDGSLALVEFGSVFALFFIAALLAARLDGRIRAGVAAAIICALLSSLIWFCLLLVTTYIFVGTARQDHFFAINETYSNFQRSGMSDLLAFVLQDFLGAGFFHTILALVIATILGAVGGLVGRLLHR